MKKVLVACGAILFSAAVFAANTASNTNAASTDIPTAADDIVVKTPAIVVSDTALAQVFMDIDNNGTKSHTIVAATSPVAQEVQLHETTHVRGKKGGMEQIKTIVIKPHGEDDLKMGGIHVMLIGLKQP